MKVPLLHHVFTVQLCTDTILSCIAYTDVMHTDDMPDMLPLLPHIRQLVRWCWQCRNHMQYLCWVAQPILT